MKYNKIAMLVAGGLMVGALNTSYASVASTSAAIDEYGSILDYGVVDASVTLTPDGTQTISDQLADFATTMSDTGWCVRSNSPAVADSSRIADLTLGTTTANPSLDSSAKNMGGYTLQLQVTALKHEDYDSAGALNDQEKGLVNTTVSIGYVGGTAPTGDDHKHMDVGADGTCSAGASSYYLTTSFPDTNKDQYAGNYSGSIQLTLGGHTDEE